MPKFNLQDADKDAKGLFKLYFKKKDGQDHLNPHNGEGTVIEWVCRCGIIRKANIKKGYSNLLHSHVKIAHPNYREVWLAWKTGIPISTMSTTPSSTNSESDIISHDNTNHSSDDTNRQLTLDHLFNEKSQNIFK
jgi:hypothetical protein